jgi:glucosamine--fructose-6-phosphate aminotransferase (isomerizing)
VAEVAARGAHILRVGASEDCDLQIPATAAVPASFAYAVFAQLLAYIVSVERGTDVDQPRNLAKSVTVE